MSGAIAGTGNLRKLLRHIAREKDGSSSIPSTDLLCDLQLLIGNWENEHKFLSGENDSQYDKGAGSAFGICAGRLKEIIKKHNKA